MDVNMKAPKIGLLFTSKPMVMPAKDAWDIVSPIMEDRRRTMKIPMHGQSKEIQRATKNAFCIKPYSNMVHLLGCVLVTVVVANSGSLIKMRSTMTAVNGTMTTTHSTRLIWHRNARVFLVENFRCILMRGT